LTLPKNKRREILVENQLYYWLCINEIECEYPKGLEGERPDKNGILPELDHRIEWMGYENIYGYSSIYSIFIEDDKSSKKAIVKLCSSDYFPNVLDPKFVKHIPITPVMVKSCIKFLCANDMWESEFKTIKECSSNVWGIHIGNAIKKQNLS
jgi:hypothetical protein